MSDPLSELSQLEGVPSALAAARDAADVVLRDRGRRQVSAEDTARALFAGATASAEIEAESHVSSATEIDWQPGSVRLSTQLLDLASLIRVAPGQAIARAHSVLARGVVAEEQLGRVRDSASERIVGLTRLLTEPTKAPAQVAAAIAHAELACAAPFGTGDGIIARAVEHMVLIAAGIDPRAALVPEAGHRAAGPAYRRSLEGYAAGSVTGVREWILHCAQALTYGAEASPLGAARRFGKGEV